MAKGEGAARRLWVVLLIGLCSLLVFRLGLAAKDSCETCHTDKISLKRALSPLAPRPAQEEES